MYAEKTSVSLPTNISPFHVFLLQLSEHRELRSILGHHPFYEEALQMAEEGKISCRVLR